MRLERDRFAVVDRGFDSPCRVWLGAKTSAGYGARRHGGRVRLVHVIEFEREHGPVPEGQVLHHRCEQRDCAEPGHLVAVTRRRHGGLHAPERCSRGHLLAVTAYVRPNGTRRCRVCRREEPARRQRAAGC